MAPITVSLAADAAAPEVTLLSALSAPISVTVEPVGRWFEVFSKRKRLNISLSASMSETTNEAKENEVNDEELFDANPEVPVKNVNTEFWKLNDLYALLGLSKLRRKATLDQIKKAYKRMVLFHHPDKKGNVSDEVAKEAEQYFSLIQKAHDVFTNPKLRLLYDSVDVDVDDRVPAVTQDEKKFYDTFVPLFEKNARWFEKQPAPLLGDRNTPYEEVAAVYEFWYNNKSWREFGFHLDPDQDDPEQAQSRDEKRWREQQLKASLKKKKTAENARLLKLIDNAYASDPRIRKFKEDAKKAKEDAKKAKEEERLEKERKAAEELKRMQEEKAASEASAKEESKKLVEFAKNTRRAFQKALKRREVFEAAAAAADGLPIPDEAKVESLRVNLDPYRLREICDLPDRASFIKAIFHEIDVAEGRVPAGGAAAGAAAEEAPKEWSADEQKLLEAALRDVSKDAADRWDQIAAAVPGRSKKDCIERVKECAKLVQANAHAKAPEAWTPDEEKVLVKAASKVFPPGTQGDRYALIAEYVKTHAHTAWQRDSKAVIAKVNAMKNITSTLASVRDGADHFSDFQKNNKSL